MLRSTGKTQGHTDAFSLLHIGGAQFTGFPLPLTLWIFKAAYPTGNMGWKLSGQTHSSPQLRAGQGYLLWTAQAANAAGQEFFGPEKLGMSQCVFMQRPYFPSTRSCA